MPNFHRVVPKFQSLTLVYKFKHYFPNNILRALQTFFNILLCYERRDEIKYNKDTTPLT